MGSPGWLTVTGAPPSRPESSCWWCWRSLPAPGDGAGNRLRARGRLGAGASRPEDGDTELVPGAAALDLERAAPTAKPRPASPARAASTAAFKARRFVWKAISLMSLMIWDVPSADALILTMARVIASMAPLPSAAAAFARCASSSACCAAEAAWRVSADIVSSEEWLCSSELACSEAPDATACDELAIWLEALETCSGPSASLLILP